MQKNSKHKGVHDIFDIPYVNIIHMNTKMGWDFFKKWKKTEEIHTILIILDCLIVSNNELIKKKI